MQSVSTPRCPPRCPPFVGVWDQNVPLTIAVAGHDAEEVDYRTLFAALALAEGQYPQQADVAQVAIENNALADGFDLGVAAFGSIYPSHRGRLEPKALELAVRLARQFLGASDEVTP